MPKRANRKTNPLLTNLFKIPNGTIYKPTGAIGQSGAFGGNLPGIVGAGKAKTYSGIGLPPLATPSAPYNTGGVGFTVGRVNENSRRLTNEPLPLPVNPQILPGGYGYRPTGTPITSQGNLNYSRLATQEPGVASFLSGFQGNQFMSASQVGLPAPTAASVTNEKRGVNWQKGTAQYGQFSGYVNGRKVNRDLRNISGRGAAETVFVPPPPPQPLRDKGRVSKMSLNWRFGAG